MAAPFLDATTFADMFRPLSDAESEVVEPYLDVVSNWIRDNKPGVADDDPAAKVVTFEVTRDALLYGDFGPLVSFSNTMGPRTKSGTLDPGAVERFITDRHRRMLGIALRAAPAFNFPVCDY